jgi:hypothetical protein
MLKSSPISQENTMPSTNLAPDIVLARAALESLASIGFLTREQANRREIVVTVTAALRIARLHPLSLVQDGTSSPRKFPKRKRSKPKAETAAPAAGSVRSTRARSA